MLLYKVILGVVKTEALLWSLADTLIIIFLLKLFNLIRIFRGSQPHRKLIPVVLTVGTLSLSVILTPHLTGIFLLEVIILNAQYLILGYAILKNHQPIKGIEKLSIESVSKKC